MTFDEIGQWNCSMWWIEGLEVRTNWLTWTKETDIFLPDEANRRWHGLHTHPPSIRVDSNPLLLTTKRKGTIIAKSSYFRWFVASSWASNLGDDRSFWAARTLFLKRKLACVRGRQFTLDISHNTKHARTDMSNTAKEVIKSKDVRKRTIHYPFWFGGSASCFAACVTHPLDLGMS